MPINMNLTSLGVNQIKTEPLDSEFDGDASSAWDFSNISTDEVARVKEEFVPEADIINELVSHPPSRPHFSVKRENVRWDCDSESSPDFSIEHNSFNSKSFLPTEKNLTHDGSIQQTSSKSLEQSPNIHNLSALNLRDVSVKLVDIQSSNVKKLRKVRSKSKSYSNASCELSRRLSALKFKEVSVKLIDIFPHKISKVGKGPTCRSQNTPSKQLKLFHRTSALNLRDVSVKLVDIFPSSVKKLGKAHSNDKACACVICRGEYKGTSAFSNFSDKHVSNSRLTVSQLLTKFQKTPRKSIKAKEKDQVSFELDDHCQKFKEGSMKQNHQKVRDHFMGVSSGCPPYSIKFKRNNTPNQHGGGAPFRVNCVKEHINQTFMCEVCSVSFKSNATLKIHSIIHTGEKPFNCAFCPKRYTKKSAVNFHMRSKHLKKKSTGRNLCQVKAKQVKCGVKGRKAKAKREYNCNYCSAKFLIQKQFMQHTVSVHHDQQPFRCKLCPTKFTQVGHLNHHVKTIHRTHRLYSCKLCSSKFFEAQELKVHFETVHHNQGLFICNLCGAKFFNNKNLNVHLKAVHYNKRRPFACNLCQTKGMGKGDLIDHIQSVHLKEKPYKCNLCSSKFGWKRSLRFHMESVHAHKENSFACKLCFLKFRWRSNLSKHVKTVHLKKKLYSCHLCSKNFSSEGYLKAHVNLHFSKEKLFGCKLCSTKFVERDRLDFHVRVVHLKEKPLSCNLCSQKFGWPSSLNNHIKSAHLNALKVFSCSLCLAKFFSSNYLTRHMKMVHLNEKLFNCNLCSAKFGQQSSLKIHLKRCILKRNNAQKN